VSIECTVYCNGCSRIIDASTESAGEARKSVREMGGRVNLPGGKDLCSQCVAAGVAPE
jgi:hypothetical protein